MLFTATNHARADAGDATDWPALKRAIVERLDVAAEYARLGVEFTRPAANAKGVRECRAFGRQDETPSAFVNVKSGVYHDSGGEGTSLHLFDFALRFDGFGRWIDVVKHYADRAGVPLGPVHPGKGGRVREAVHLYRDEAGEVRYAVFRYRLPSGAKSFSQHPPDGRGGWKFGAGCMEGVEPLPYRLPELVAADPEATVWVVEGEKDADRLGELGLVATTNHQGAGSTDVTWPRFAGRFAGRDVVILPDNDAAGRRHARKVAGHLHGIARRVRVVELPGLGRGGDVSDWLDLGHDEGELFRLALGAPDFDPSAPGADDGPDPGGDRKDATVADLRRHMEGIAWLWEGWIPGSALTLLASEAGTGKTRFCFDLHRRIANRLCWPDGTPIPESCSGRVLWVLADNQHREACDIPGEFGIPDEVVFLNTAPDDPFGGTGLQTADELAQFEARIGRLRPDLVVIDTVTNTADYKSQDTSDAKRQYKPLQEVAMRCQVAILCVTHLNLAGKVLGRRAIEKVRVVIQLDQPDPGQEHRRKLWVSKSKALKPPPLGVTMGSDGNEYDDTPPESPPQDDARPAAAKAPRVDECMEWLSRRLRAGAQRVGQVRDAAEREGFSSKTLYAAFRQLGAVEFLRDERKWWQLPPDRAADDDAPAF